MIDLRLVADDYTVSQVELVRSGRSCRSDRMDGQSNRIGERVASPSMHNLMCVEADSARKKFMYKFTIRKSLALGLFFIFFIELLPAIESKVQMLCTFRLKVKYGGNYLIELSSRLILQAAHRCQSWNVRSSDSRHLSAVNCSQVSPIRDGSHWAAPLPSGSVS